MTEVTNSKTTNPVKVGVVGAGVMGQNHLRVYDGLKNTRLIGLFDPDQLRAKELAAEYNCVSYPNLAELAAAIDAVSVCSPSVTHHECGHYLIDQGIHCLIEKPLATSQEDCLDLIEKAKLAKVKLLVGHIERFNPAVQQIFSLLRQGANIQAIEARRLSSVSARIKDVDVVMDLMVHDLDIVLALVDSKVTSIQASEVRTEESQGGNYVTALLGFENGIAASVTASRISPNPVRSMSVTTDQGTVEIDYQNQSADVYLKSSLVNRGGEYGAFGQYASSISMENVQIRRQEPLQLELKHFVDIIREDLEPFVSGHQALSALEAVWEIQKIIGNEK